eukprot:1079048_1
MQAWGKDQGIEGSMITFVADPAAELTKALGMEMTHAGPPSVGIIGDASVSPSMPMTRKSRPLLCQRDLMIPLEMTIRLPPSQKICWRLSRRLRLNFIRLCRLTDPLFSRYHYLFQFAYPLHYIILQE